MANDGFVRYDISALEPIERALLRDRLNGDAITFRLTEDVLIVDDADEAAVDVHIVYVEAYAKTLQQESQRAELVKQGRSDLARCEVCGDSPAAPITLRRQTAMVVVRSTHQLSAVLCDRCAAAATKSYQTQTAVKGWTGVVSALSNPVFLASNAANRRKHKKNLNS